MNTDEPERHISLSGKNPDMVEAQLLLGQMYLDNSDFSRAFEMFSIAARSGRPRALNMLGRAYDRGWGVPRNVFLAVKYFEVAAQDGDGWAEFNLGDIYLTGDGLPADPVRAYGHYIIAAQKGVAKALNMLGLMHEQGICGSPDPEGARQFFEAAGEGGDCWACFNMGRLILDKNDVELAAHWFERSLSLGFSEYWQCLETFLKDAGAPVLRRIAAEARHRQSAGKAVINRKG